MHNNPVKHNLATDARNYPWCSMSWFNQHAPDAFRRTVSSFKYDRRDYREYRRALTLAGRAGIIADVSVAFRTGSGRSARMSARPVFCGTAGRRKQTTLRIANREF